jgi:hypothetical protein
VKIRAIVVWIVVPVLVGTVLLLAGVQVVARVPTFLFERQFFGLSPAVVFAVADFVVWSLMSVPAGLLVGYLAWRRPIPIALSTCAVALLAFLLSTLLDDLEIGVLQTLELFWKLLLSMIVFVTLGALLGAKLRRGLTMRWSGP